MKKSSIFLSFLIFLVYFGFSQEVRPIKDDIGFCWEKKHLKTLVTYLETHKKCRNILSQNKLIGGISPHDDYLYAAGVYLPLFKRIQAKEIVVFGVCHSSVRKKIKSIP